ncbi:MAG: TPM domain-containing protein [Bacteroidales bacterium]|nr:TPM domain-containing protein [Bacteroidales bacterium]
MTSRTFFSKEEQQRIVAAIKEAELDTSGEIRVHIENHCKEEALERAAELFYGLKMDRTAARNGILFYLAVKDHKFAIIGDEGINKNVEHDFWNDIKNEMISNFKENKFTEGLIAGILKCGEKLKEYFPHQDDDVNELSDEISFS